MFLFSVSPPLVVRCLLCLLYVSATSDSADYAHAVKCVSFVRARRHLLFLRESEIQMPALHQLRVRSEIRRVLLVRMKLVVAVWVACILPNQPWGSVEELISTPIVRASPACLNPPNSTACVCLQYSHSTHCHCRESCCILSMCVRL